MDILINTHFLTDVAQHLPPSSPYLKRKLRSSLTPKLPWVTKTEFLLTTLIQYQEDKW